MEWVSVQVEQVVGEQIDVELVAVSAVGSAAVSAVEFAVDSALDSAADAEQMDKGPEL